MIEVESVKTLIPQREPIIMLDSFHEATETEAKTGLTVAVDNIFVDEDRLTEPGLVEHIAQSASALAGYWAVQQGKTAPTGYIGEIKQCRINFMPRTGETLRTRVKIVSEMLGVSLLEAETRVGEQIAVQCRMKIFIKPE